MKKKRHGNRRRRRAKPKLPDNKEKRGNVSIPAGRWWPLLFTIALAISGVVLLATIRHTLWRDGSLGPSAESVSHTQSPQEIANTERVDASPVVDSYAKRDESLVPIKTAKLTAEVVGRDKLLDPSLDGWDTEVAAEAAKKILEGLTRQVVGAEHEMGAASDMVKSIAMDFRCGFLRPVETTEEFRDDSIVIRRESAPAPTDGGGLPSEFRGPSGLVQALRELAIPFRNARDIHRHAKIVRVRSEGDRLWTTAYVEIAAHTAGGAIQSNANWDCEWRKRADESLQLVSLRAYDFRETTTQAPAGVWFVDCTQSALGHNASFSQQIARGLNYWLGRLGREHGLHAFTRTGMAVGDVNSDGLDDIYLCQPGGLPNRLYIHNSDGTATDHSAESGVDWLDESASALFVDLDNDGDQDLVVSTKSGLLLMENNGQGQFALKNALRVADTDLLSLSAADYDTDGDLDLYVCVEFPNQVTINAPSTGFVYHDANDGGSNVLFRNDIQDGESTEPSKSWKFTDVTEEVGLGVHNRRHSLAAAWEDYDNDGDSDLYVANDYGQNCLYRNDDGRFVDVAPDLGVVDFGSGMSVSWGDFDRDGWMDLYVANMFSSAGNRITRQTGFRQHEQEEVRSLYSRFAKGNSLFRNEAEPSDETNRQFHEVSSDAGVEMGRWAWSSLFADINNDGWEDLLVANGYISTEDSGDL